MLFYMAYLLWYYTRKAMVSSRFPVMFEVPMYKFKSTHYPQISDELVMRDLISSSNRDKPKIYLIIG